MTLKEIQKKIAELEGKKKSISMGDVREIVSIVSDLMYTYPDVVHVLLSNGARRARRKK